jgi:hypothetical protein
MTESRKQKAESRKQKAESRRQKAESRRQKGEGMDGFCYCFLASASRFWLLSPAAVIAPA